MEQARMIVAQNLVAAKFNGRPLLPAISIRACCSSFGYAMQAIEDSL